VRLLDLNLLPAAAEESEKQHSAAVTSSMLGCFRNEEETRSEFLSLIRNRANGV